MTKGMTISSINLVWDVEFDDAFGFSLTEDELPLEDSRLPQETFEFPNVLRRGVLVPHTPFLYMIIRMKSCYMRRHDLTHR